MRAQCDMPRACRPHVLCRRRRRRRLPLPQVARPASAIQASKQGCSAAMAVQIEASPKRSPWERAVAKFGAYFEEQGLGAADVPAAIVIHEVRHCMLPGCHGGLLQGKPQHAPCPPACLQLAAAALAVSTHGNGLPAPGPRCPCPTLTATGGRAGHGCHLLGHLLCRAPLPNRRSPAGGGHGAQQAGRGNAGGLRQGDGTGHRHCPADELASSGGRGKAGRGRAVAYKQCGMAAYCAIVCCAPACRQRRGSAVCGRHGVLKRSCLTASLTPLAGPGCRPLSPHRFFGRVPLPACRHQASHLPV